MPDALGYRLKIGSIIASTNACVEPEFAAMSVAGVTHLSARARILEQDLSLDTTELIETMCATLAQLNDAKPDLVFVATPALCLLPCKEARQNMHDILARTAHSPILLAHHAVRDALNSLGAKRIGISTPYPVELDEAIVSWFEASGFSVAAIAGTRPPDDLSALELSPDRLAMDLQQLIDRADDIDVLVQLGTNVAMARLIEGFEYRFGKPVVTSNIASWWAALRGAGIKDSLTGFGQLMREL